VPSIAERREGADPGEVALTRARESAWEIKTAPVDGVGDTVRCRDTRWGPACERVDSAAEMIAQNTAGITEAIERTADALEAPAADDEPGGVELKHCTVNFATLDDLACRHFPGIADVEMRYDFGSRADLARIAGRAALGLHVPKADGSHLVMAADDLSPAETARVLAHELGHASLAAATNETRGADYLTMPRTFRDEYETGAKSAESGADLIAEAITERAIQPSPGGRREVRGRRVPDLRPRAQRIIRHDQARAVSDRERAGRLRTLVRAPGPTPPRAP